MMTRYYIFKKICNKLPQDLLSNMNIEDEKLLNLADFLSTPFFYKRNIKKDKYKIYETLNGDKFYDFFTEVLISSSKYFSYDVLLLCYALITYRLENEYLIPYINELKADSTDVDEALNMLDYYFAKKIDNMDLKKTNLALKYPDAFTYLNFIDKIIHHPIIKTCSLFETKNYFIRAYKKKTHFYNYYTKSSLGFTKLYAFIYKKLSKNKTINHSFYIDVMDTALLNMPKKSFTINNKTYNYNLDELINHIMKASFEYYNAINDYLIFGKDKKIKKLLNISSEKIM